MKHVLSAIALACVFSVPAQAGYVPTSGVTSPQPGGTTQPAGTTSPGDVPISGYAEQISDAALSGLLALLGSLVV